VFRKETLLTKPNISYIWNKPLFQLKLLSTISWISNLFLTLFPLLFQIIPLTKFFLKVSIALSYPKNSQEFKFSTLELNYSWKSNCWINYSYSYSFDHFIIEFSTFELFTNISEFLSIKHLISLPIFWNQNIIYFSKI